MKTNVLKYGVAMTIAAFATVAAHADVISWEDTGKIVNPGFSADLGSGANGWVSGGSGFNRSWDKPAYTSSAVGIIDTWTDGAAFSSIQQDVSGLALNTDHKITFDVYEALGVSNILVLAGGVQLAITTVKNPANAGIATPQELVFNTGTASTVTIMIHTNGTENGGVWDRAYLVLDDVVLSQAAAVPEPAALGLLAVGTMAALLRRK